MLRACVWRAGKFGEGDTLDAQVPISAYARTERGMGRQPHPAGGFGGLEAPQGARGGLPPAIRGRSPRTRGVARECPGCLNKGSGGLDSLPLEAPQGGAGGGSPRIPRDKQSTRSRIAFMHQARHDVFAVANNHGQLTLSHQLRVPWNIEWAAPQQHAPVPSSFKI